MRKLHLLFLTFAVILFFSLNGYSQLTTSAIKGVVSAGNENLPGATVLVVHGPTGAKYGSTTNGSGVYNLANLNPGGPYSVTVSFVGYNSYTKKDLYLNLGQTFQLNVELKESASELEEVLVRGGGVGVFDGNTTGSKTTVSNEMISNMPMLSRSISDVARLTPQAKLNSYGGLEIAGQNSKYNSFTIDGAVQNDVFGLASNGTNGGQINLNPMSMDIIDQITISVSPYDVTQSGFAGAGINAVTKSGTNKFTGTVYDYFRNQALAGKTPTDNPDLERKPLDDFTSNTTGFTLGGPIIKDKVFFFINTEIQKDNTPKPFDFATYTGAAKASDLTLLTDKLVNDYGYDAGTYGDVNASLNATKVYAKIDWNINQNHKFSIRHQYSKGRSISPGTSSKTTINFSNTGIDFTSTTNATTAELKSIFNNKFANKLLVGYTYVDDDRNPMGGNFPYLAFTAEKVNLGSESFSAANRLTQGIFTFTDDFSLYLNKHNITLGMHHEYYDMFNVFIRQNFGQYTYATIGDFLNLNPATRYQRSFSNIDAITGDGTAAAAAFKVLQLGFYAQDDYQVTKNFNLTYGLRVDVPMYLTEAAVNDDFNNKVIPYLQSTYNVDMMGAKTGQMPKASPLFSPRAGFNWDVNGDKTFQLRGGIGLFTSRIPYVWPGGQYNNNGITVGGMDIRTAGDEKLKFNPAWDKQPTLAGKPSGQIDLFAEDFKMPQVIRMNIAADKKLGNGFNATVDVTYTKNVNNVTYQNLLVQPNGKKLTGTGDNREIWSNVSSDVNKNSGAIGSYTGVFLGSNTNKGDAFNFMAQVDKTFDFGLSASLAYNYGVATSINDGQSSQNSSQWRVVNGNGRNNLDLGYSVYDLGHRIIANVAYKIEYSKFTNTTISLFYNGQSGERYSMGYNNGYDAVNKRDFYGPNGDNTDGYDLTLLYVPKDKSDINFVNVIDKDGNVTYSADQQWTDFNQFIEDHKSLKNSRGKVVDRHSERMPFGNILDLKVMQEFKFKVAAEHENKIQIALDVFNFTNMLNKNWGRMYYPLGDYSNYQVLQFAGYINDGTTPAYNYYNKSGNETWGIDDAGLQSSRWQAQLSVRYIF
jgi:hypothetical protein